MNVSFPSDEAVMMRAIELARLGLGSVEPNPAVGAVLVDTERNLIAEGHHQKFGEAHAEINALSAAGERARGATLFVTLEPCCHTGKTGPCSQAVIDAGIARVVVGVRDPAPHVDGGGIRELQEAGIKVEVGLCEVEAARLVEPFVKLVTTGLPWVHAKWAMTWDGKIAARTGHSQWISGEQSRQLVHQLRGRMDGVIVGAKTALFDDPTLTARPPGQRTATRIVIDSKAALPVTSKLVATIGEAPVLLATTTSADDDRIASLVEHGVEVLRLKPGVNGRVPIPELLQELGRRQMTNLLLEGGGELLGDFFDEDLIDELHLFLAPKIVGGAEAISPFKGLGLEEIPQHALDVHETRSVGGDLYLNATVR
ncbi:bifunctional diaminohydroxyphosphoribosylaminopyrimidine deaminase/5-amino-6-(5-phosphoribosylamino)uracil reductase RibD [Calycomorphotria hydatis]|uniref:Riboflavin biosynthesis protein RibD n=1 Tax=Calycomorphotria hydatis TaxID=2528027 RepID=A0A517TCE0_9PLAN|nr:bifunctional diaminohydroxyphosphoribosylaminopyrimidine deaminase/5-amino-6-(5-phosphoribosylamino)uracil reductase RibD [Calycomorphotria hydatis]QDT66020.1 Riboflavin biosynthesis protein RibD [Calycomorphotria hydatis]